MVGQHVFRSNQGANLFVIVRLVTFFIFGNLCFSILNAQQCQTAIQNNQFDVKPAICTGTSALLQGSLPTGGNGTYTYQWQISNGNCSDDSFVPIPGATSKDYHVPSSADPQRCYRRRVVSGSCTTYSNKGKVQGSDITTPTAPSVSVTQPTCQTNGGTITITNPAPSNGLTFSIDGVNYTNTNGIFTGLAAGTYSVTARHVSGCTSPSRSVSISAPAPLPAGSVSPSSATLCEGQNQVLTASGGSSYRWYRNGSLITGATSSTYTATQAGTYRVETVQGSCVGPLSNGSVVSVASSPIGVISPASTTLCPGDSVLLSTSGGVSYQWYRDGNAISGAVSSTYRAKQGGTYTVDIINSNGCKAKATNNAVVSISSIPTGNISPASANICTGGSATLTANGGASYQWYRNGIAINGATSSTYSATQAGTYTVDIISSSACKGVSSNSSVVTSASITATAITPSSGQLCGTNASLLLTATGGSSYQWFRNGSAITGATSATYSVTQAGTYTADIINGNCTVRASNNVVVTQVNTPTGNISPATATICAGSSQTLTASGGTSYQWMKDGVAITGATSVTYAATQPGVYTVTINNGTCSGPASNSATMTVSSSPSGSISPATATICNGGSQTLTANGGSSYQWYRNNIAISGATSATYAAIQSGTYSVDIINSNGCKAKASNETVVTVSAPPNGSISPSTANLCTGDSVILVTSGGVSYQWYRNGSAISGATSASYKAKQSGTYTVEITNSNGCKAMSSNQAVVSITNAPSGSISPPNVTICSGGSATLTATGGVSYQWYKDGVLINGATSATHNVTQPGTYSADIINASGCKGTSTNSAVVVVGSAPTSAITPASGQLCGNNASVVLTIGGGTTYQWYRNGVVINGATFSTYTVTTAGTYSATIISGTCSGQSSNQVTVTQGSIPTGSISPSTATICTGGSTTLTATGGTSYQWYRDGVAINNATGSTYNASQAGTYTVDIFNSGGCKGTSSNNSVVTVGSVTPTAITPASGQLCGANASILLTATGGTSYQWFKDGVAVNGATSGTYTATSQGVYTADIINGTCRVRASNNVAISLVNAPSGNIAPATATICSGSSQTLTANGGTSYQWARDGINIPGATSATYVATQSGVYTVTIINGTCSGQASNSATVVISSNPIGTISPASAALCTGSSQVLTVSGGSSYQWYRNNVLIQGATNPTYTATQSGTYSADIVNANGCKAKASNEVVITTSAAPSSSISPSSASLCAGDSVTLSTSGGASYQWFKDGTMISGATSSAYKAKQSGTYTVEVSNANGCKAMSTNQGVVTLASLPAGTISPANVTICTGGSATLTASGGASYQWYKDGVIINGATSATYNVTQQGTYTADIFGANGCKGTSSNSSVVSIGSSPSSAITPASGQLCGSNAMVVLTVGGGTSYQWYRNGVLIPGATSATYSVTTVGIYTAHIISGTCIGQASNQVVITLGNPPTGTISPSTAGICQGGSQVLTATGGTSYQWFRNNTAITGATSATYTATQAGTYSVTISNSGCSAPSTNVATVTEANGPTGTISPATAVICTGASQVLTATGGASYQWYRNGVIINGATASTYTATTEGVYSVDVINSNGCKAKASNDANVTISSAPSGNISPSSGTLCNNGSLTLTTSGGVSYQWYRNDVLIPGATGSSLTVTSTGNYTVDIINANGCKAKATNAAAITTGTAPTGTISPSSAAICASQSVTLTATGGTSYQWFRNGSLLTNATAATYQATLPGIYSVLIFSGNCNGPASNTATVSESTPLTFSLNIAQPNCTQNSGSITVSNPFGGIGNGYMYSIDGGVNFQSSNVFTNVPIGTFQVVMKDAAGCQSNSTQVVISQSTSTVQGSVTTTSITCTQTSATATVTASGGTAPYQYSLNNGSFQSANTFTNLPAGNYKITVKDASGCIKDITFSIQAINSTLNAGVAITNPTCHQQNGSVEVTASGGSPGYTYSLNNGTFQASNSFSNIPIGSHKVKVRDQAGCLFEVTFEIRQTTTNPNLVVTNPGTICSSATIDLQASSITQGSDNGLTFTYWKDSNATLGVLNAGAVSPGTYYIKATNSIGCITIKPVVVSAFPQAVGRITANGSTTPCSGQTILLTATDGQTYQWYRDSVLISGATTKTLTVSQNGVYTVVISDGRCPAIASDTVRIQFRNCPTTTEPKVYVPTGFTPNNNNANDLLRPILHNVSELKYFKVYNRWGQVVFQTNVIGKGWDGKINGLLQPAEPYSWILECVDMNGNTIRQSGRTVLIR